MHIYLYMYNVQQWELEQSWLLHYALKSISKSSLNRQMHRNELPGRKWQVLHFLIGNLFSIRFGTCLFYNGRGLKRPCAAGNDWQWLMEEHFLVTYIFFLLACFFLVYYSELRIKKSAQSLLWKFADLQIVFKCFDSCKM